MSMSASKSMVSDAAKQLIEAWRVARRDWDDETARRFEAEFLEPISPKIRGTVAAIDKLSTLSTRAKRDCE